MKQIHEINFVPNSNIKYANLLLHLKDIQIIFVHFHKQCYLLIRLFGFNLWLLSIDIPNERDIQSKQILREFCFFNKWYCYQRLPSGMDCYGQFAVSYIFNRIAKKYCSLKQSHKQIETVDELLLGRDGIPVVWCAAVCRCVEQGVV